MNEALQPVLILLPSLILATLTLSLIGLMGLRRSKAVNAGVMDPRFYRLYTGGEEPPELRVLTRHVQNHFEVPPLFHIVCLVGFVSGMATPWLIALSWLYVALRFVHTGVHLGGNRVQRRFQVFGASLFTLMLMILTLIVQILSQLVNA